MAILESVKNARNNYRDGGPFGAVIVRGDEIISHAHNTVIKSKDPTAHAEVNAIRMAAKKLDTHDLSGCVLYTSAEPCPMCLSAIVWANIREVYYANSREDTEDIGFRDDKIYEYIKSNWTFHGKGIWLYKRNEDTPSISIIGSSNYSKYNLFNTF